MPHPRRRRRYRLRVRRSKAWASRRSWRTTWTDWPRASAVSSAVIPPKYRISISVASAGFQRPRPGIDAPDSAGRALSTGKWKDVGKVKGPVLRGLSARAPYFHNGSAGSLGDVIDFYNQRFDVGFTPQEREDLIAFLRGL